MRTLAVLPVKSFSGAKQRLAPLLAGGSRRALAQAMFSDVLATLRRVEQVERIAVVTSDVTVLGAGHDPQVVGLPDPRETGQSDATRIGLDYALSQGFDRALLVPGDVPLLDPAELGSTLDRAEAEGLDAVIVPDRHDTGTNALLLTLPARLEPSFGPGSLERHREAARRAELAHRVEPVPTLLHDVDTPADLVELNELLAARRGDAPLTRGALRQIDRAGGVPEGLGDTRRTVVIGASTQGLGG